MLMKMILLFAAVSGSLAQLARDHRHIVCAWGANARPERVAAFERLMERNGGILYRLGFTQAGQPRHPLYLKRDVIPRRWLKALTR